MKLSGDPAPDFGRSGYPSRGELIGPAWQAMWDDLAEDRWTFADVAISGGCAAGVQPKTALNLLRSARRAGILEVEYRKIGNPTRRRPYYRIKASR